MWEVSILKLRIPIRYSSMGQLNELYLELVSKVQDDDISSQQYYLSVVAEQRQIPVSYLQSLGMLFIPNNDYIEYYLGPRIRESIAGLYYGSSCPWTLCYTIPIRDLSGEIVGLVGWDAYNKYRELTDETVEGMACYRVSPKSVFAREKYFLADIGVLRQCFQYKTVFVTDGVFDALALSYRSIPSIALLGSSFSSEILYFLSWFNFVRVCSDNDAAGLSLYRKLSKALSNVYKVQQNKCKDIEELLRRDGRDGIISQQFHKLVKDPIPDDFIIKL